MKLFIDDIRNAPDDTWTLVRTVTEAIRFIGRYWKDIEVISIDHDISYQVELNGLSRPYPSPETYQSVAMFIEVIYMFVPAKPKIIIHSANPVGAEAIKNILVGFPIEIKAYGPANRLESN